MLDTSKAIIHSRNQTFRVEDFSHAKDYACIVAITQLEVFEITYQAIIPNSSVSGITISSLINGLYSSGIRAPACTQTSTTAGAFP